MSIWYTTAVWRTIDAPRFKPGFIAASVLGVAMVALSLVLRLLQKKDERKRAQENDGVRDVESPLNLCSTVDDVAHVGLGKEIQK